MMDRSELLRELGQLRRDANIAFASLLTRIDRLASDLSLGASVDGIETDEERYGTLETLTEYLRDAQ